ncbi:phosphate acyltransferase PlsX [Aurantivibrio infirmus]
MSTPIRIAIDTMGGDLGPDPIVSAALQLLDSLSSIHTVLVGDEQQISPLLKPLKQETLNRIELVHASDVVSMSDKPSVVLRHKQNSSMWIALDLVKEKKVDACVSAGNTGALMAMGKYLLKTFPGIERPAICKPVPSSKGQCYLLDLGANINCTAEQLVQFAFMGSVLAMVSDSNPKPSVGLLNIGEENIKGIEQVRVAADILNTSDQINYAGFVEGNDIYTGDVDVIVCDGFVGNIALKVSEGAAKFLAENIKAAFTKSWYGRLAGLFAYPVVSSWREKYNPVRHNGACFLGLQGTVIKSHGGTDALGFYHALLMAVNHVKNQIPEKINLQFEELFV